MKLELDDNNSQARIKVVGVGGGGGNAVANMIAMDLGGVDFIAVNTDGQALDSNPAPNKVQIGSSLTKGLGAGGIPDQGRMAALENVHQLQEFLNGSEMVFVACGMGGGTGTGAAPIVAQVARDAGALTVGVITKPFRFEGRKRAKLAEEGILAISDEVDSLICIPNEKLLTMDENLTMDDAFICADQVLSNAVRGISDLITVEGKLNVDFADVKTIMNNRGRALMGTGYGKGETRAIDAAKQAINSPLLDDVTIDGALGVLVNITGGPDLTLRETDEAVGMIEDAVSGDAHVIFGYVRLEEPSDEVKITVIATGFNTESTQSINTKRISTNQVIQNNARYSIIGSKSRSSVPNSKTAIVSSNRNSESEQINRTSVVRTTATGDSELDIPTYLRRQSEI